MTDLSAVRINASLYGITFKLGSVACFIIMAAFLKASEGLPAGQLVFFRSFVGLIPILVFLMLRGKLRESLRSNNIWGHLLRGVIGVGAMGCGFFALTKLPLPEATTINYAAPLLMVILGALVLRELVSPARWIAVGAGLGGVLIIVWPRLSMIGAEGGANQDQMIGAVVALIGAVLVAIQTLTIRTLVKSEKSSTVVIYYSIMSSILALTTIIFGWGMPTPWQWVFLICAGVIGGFGQILLTESLRHSEVSALAPFEYTSIVFSIGIGFFIFGDVPTLNMLAGGLLVIAAGLYIVLRTTQPPSGSGPDS